MGLDTTAPPDAVRQRASELQAYVGIGATKTYPIDFPVFSAPSRTIESVAAAMQRWETPRDRLLDVVTWFTIQDPVDAAASASLMDGRIDQAARLWSEAAASVIPESSTYLQNRAVLALAQCELRVANRDDKRAVWADALLAWAAVFRDSEYWAALISRCALTGDPRVSPGLAQEIRRDIAEGLVAVCAREVASVVLTDGASAARWMSIVYGAGLPDDLLPHALERASEAALNIIKTEIGAARQALSRVYETEGAGTEGAQLEKSIERLLQTCAHVVDPLPHGTRGRDETADALADAVAALGRFWITRGSDVERGRHYMKTAASVAASNGLRVRLQHEERVVRWNAAHDALAEASRRRDHMAAVQALQGLEQSYDATDGAEIEAVLVQARETVHWLRLTGEGTPIERVPNLWCLNGFGTRIYGTADPDPATGTYVGTRFITALWIPIFAVSRFRMKNEGNLYRYYRKLPLARGHWIWNAVAALVLLTLFGAAQENDPPRRQKVPPRLPTATTPAPQSDTGSVSDTTPTTPPPAADMTIPTPGTRSRYELGEEIKRRRPLLEQEQSSLDTESAMLSSERSALNALRRQIEDRRGLYPDGLPSHLFAHDKIDVAEHNGRLEALNRRIATWDNKYAVWERKRSEFNNLVAEYNRRR